MRRKPIATCAAFCLLATHAASAQEAVLEEVRVESSFLSDAELRQEKAVVAMIERLTQRVQRERAQELQIANRTPLSTLLDLTKYSPMRLGGSDDEIDPFSLRNDMRPEFNPRNDDPLSLRR